MCLGAARCACHASQPQAGDEGRGHQQLTRSRWPPAARGARTGFAAPEDDGPLPARSASSRRLLRPVPPAVGPYPAASRASTQEGRLARSCVSGPRGLPLALPLAPYLAPFFLRILRDGLLAKITSGCEAPAKIELNFLFSKLPFSWPAALVLFTCRR